MDLRRNGGWVGISGGSKGIVRACGELLALACPPLACPPLACPCIFPPRGVGVRHFEGWADEASQAKSLQNR